MKKASKKIVKYLLLMAMIISEFMTPISAFAAQTVPARGDLGINGVVSDKAIVSTSAYTTAKQDGEVQAIKTVSKVAGQEGKYQVDFTVKGEKVETLKQNDIYVVLAFDTSNSMLCGEHFVRGPGPLTGNYDYQIDENDDTTRIRCTSSSGLIHYPGSLTKDKWENAVKAAVEFGTELAKFNNAHISLVNYGGTATTATDFVDNKVLEGTENTSLLSKSDFHYVSDGTNMEAALKEAERKLDEIKDSNVEKYILLIGDGIPTVDDNFQLDSKEAAKKVANDIKSGGIEIFTIGYGLDGIGEAHSILKELSSDCDANGQCSQTNYYHNKASISTSNADSIAKIMHSMAIKFGEAKNAGPSAKITDNIGDSFKIVNSIDGTLSDAKTIDLTFGEITPEGETKSFIVQIDENASKGWHDVNRGFVLNYKNYLEQDATPIVYEESENQPQVYWEPNNYVVNYYKDSISANNKLSSYEGYAPNGTEIDIDDINIEINGNPYLVNLPEHYRFDSIDPESIIVTNNGTVQEINVLYKNEYKYVVNYYYDGQIDSQLTETIGVPYGTKVNSADYHTKNVKSGYVLDTDNSTIDEYTITDDSVIINVYFERTYDYSVKYYFNGIEGLYTNPAGTATSGSVINASDHFLSFSELNGLNRGDYFVDTTNPNYTPTITIGANNNLLEIYYINPVFSNENVEKTTTTTEITNSRTPVDYKITYSVDITNVKDGSTIITTIVDTLPYEIDESLSQLNNGNYDGVTKTITWEITETVSEYTQNKTKIIEYSVVYKDFADISASNNNVLINNVSAKTTVDQTATSTGDETESTGDTDSVEIPVNVMGTLKVLYVDENDNPIKEQVGPTTQPVGTRYTTTQEKIAGYIFDRVEGNPRDTYTEGETVVKYIYKKVVVSKNEITKTGPETVKSINDTFTYTITYEGEIQNYEGEAKLVLTDTPDFKVSELLNTSDSRCSLNNGEVICNANYYITQNNNKINDTFIITVKYSNIDKSEVGNTVKAVLTYDNIDTPTEDSSTETKVESGDLKVIHNIIDAEGKVIETLKEETTTALGGVAYETEEEKYYGYTLKEVIGNEKGNYIANTTVTVEYRYTKNIGTSDETLEKVGNAEVGTINSKFDYTITYETIIKDYKGNATLTIIDTLPYKIDLNKSIFNTNNCTYSYKDGKATITCKYEKAIDQENQKISVLENLSLYYIDLEENGITNKVESVLEYGETTKEHEYEFTTEVTEGKVKVNYVTLENNKYIELTDAVLLEGMIDYTYKTEEKEFDNYTLKEVIGEETGVFTLEDIEVTYVYELNKMPPKTGVQVPITNGVGYINYVLILLVGLVCRRRYN